MCRNGRPLREILSFPCHLFASKTHSDGEMNLCTQSHSTPTDPELLALCLRGEREAFGALVARYQGLVCAQAYAVCGDFGRSEDVAQEVFVSAWRQLRDLRDHSKFKAWICGMARHLALRVAERTRREDLVADAAEFEEAPSSAENDVVSRDEERVVWSALAELPETYRVVLTLYYREQQSVSEVARELELTEDAVKQRLSRGRALLREEVTGMVENALRVSRPGAALTAAILGVVAASVPSSASAASLVAIAKTGAPMKAAFLAPALASLFGVAVGIFGGWFGVKVTEESARTERERLALVRIGRRVFAIATGGALFQAGAVLLLRFVWPSHITLLPYVICATILPSIAWGLWETWNCRKIIAKIRAEDEASGAPRRQPRGPWRYLAAPGMVEYRSRASFLGQPLVHIRWSAPDPSRVRQAGARGWIALGDSATGFVAVGGFARGFVAIGGVALGVVSCGGISLGAIGLGGLAAAGWSYGGIALGWLAQGGVALGWHAAAGALALARDFAVGALASAAETNNEPAQAAVSQSIWLTVTSQPWFAFVVPAIVLGMLLVMAAVFRKFWKRAG